MTVQLTHSLSLFLKEEIPPQSFLRPLRYCEGIFFDASATGFGT